MMTNILKKKLTAGKWLLKTASVIVFSLVLLTCSNSNRTEEQKHALIVRSNDLVYHSVPVSKSYGAPVGNGQFGGTLVFNQHELTWQMNHTGFWRFNEQTTTHYKYGARPFGLGRLTFKWEGVPSGSDSTIQARMGLYNGIFTLTPKPQLLTIENLFDMDRDCGIFRIQSESQDTLHLTVELEGWRPKVQLEQTDKLAMISDPSDVARSSHEIAYLEKLTKGEYDTLRSTHATGIKLVGENISQLPESGMVRAFEVELYPEQVIYVYAATSVLEGTGDLPDPVERTKQLLELESGMAYKSQMKDHLEWWQNFWDASYIQLESDDSLAAFAENLWYLNLYEMAASDRGKYPAKFNWGNWYTQGDDRLWGGGYWHYNQQFNQLSMLAANHLEFVGHYYDPLFEHLDLIKAQTQEIWNQPGAFVHETHSPEGLAYEDNRNRIYKDSIRWTGLIFSTSAECAYQMYKYSLYNGDENYRKEVVFPFMREVCTFYAHRFKKEDDGFYHIHPSNAHENFWKVKDPQTDLAAVRACFPLLIKMYEDYGSDENEKVIFEDILDNLAPFPKGKWLTTKTNEEHDFTWYGIRITGIDSTIDMFAPAIIMGDDRVHNYHGVDYYAVYPFEVILPGDPEFETAVTTFKNRFYKPTSNFLQHDILPPALLRLPNEFRENFSDYISLRPQMNNILPWGEYIAMPSLALNYMLLQNQRGILNLFPTCPENWNASFKLRAEGPLIVEARKENGVVKACKIQCLKNQEITVANVWNKEVSIFDGSDEILSSVDSLIRWQGTEGKTYQLVEKGTSSEDVFPVQDRKPNEKAKRYRRLVLGTERIEN